tara:strand:+ start:471 stop:755 length:285 start_codon:yes stop_codon:yes gene_type:complete
MSAVRERQKKAFNRILDILEEKRDINETIMNVEDRKKLIAELEDLTAKYYKHINDWARHYKSWIEKGKCNEMEYFRLCEDYRKLLREEYEVRFE